MIHPTPPVREGSRFSCRPRSASRASPVRRRSPKDRAAAAWSATSASSATRSRPSRPRRNRSAAQPAPVSTRTFAHTEPDSDPSVDARKTAVAQENPCREGGRDAIDGGSSGRRHVDAGTPPRPRRRSCLRPRLDGCPACRCGDAAPAVRPCGSSPGGPRRITRDLSIDAVLGPQPEAVSLTPVPAGRSGEEAPPDEPIVPRQIPSVSTRPLRPRFQSVDPSVQ